MATPRDRGYKRGMKTQDALAVANWFIDRAVADGAPIDMLKLQRLVYLAHGWSLAITGLPLLRQRPEAWDFGPVIPAIYRAFADVGRQPITRKATIADAAASVFRDLAFREVPAPRPVVPRVEDPDVVALLQRVWEVYRGFTGVQLSNLSHRPGGAWSRILDDHPQAGPGIEIPDTLIKDEFERDRADARPVAAAP